MLVTLIAPAYNEEGNIRALYDAVDRAFFHEADLSCELVIVDDGSSDGTFAAMQGLPTPPAPHRLATVSFSRNFGKEAALYAGLQRAHGDIVVFIDSDLQQPPHIARQMVQALIDNPDADCVAAYQEQRERGLRSKLSHQFYRLLGASSNLDVLADASDFRAFRRPVADALLSMSEYYRFTKGLFAWVGFKTLPFPYTPAERHAGTTKWSARGLLKYAANGLLSFSTAPMKIAMWIGGIASLAAFVYAIVVIVQRLAFGIDVPGYATIVCLVLLLGGIILLMQGIMGEYLARTYIEGKHRPIYLVRRESVKGGNEESR
jgi:glycosyltransferase involved in cell wall biosynthesis